MRVRTALLIFAALNVLWAAAFIGYTHRSNTPVVRPANFAEVTVPSSNAIKASTTITQAVAVTVPKTNLAPGPTNSQTVRPTSPVKIASADKQFGWQDVTNEVYQQYIANLRSVGCPEKQIRNIVIADANELFDKRRLEFAIKTDAQWWKADTFMGVLPMQGAAGVNFDEERREILEKLIGSKWDDGIRLPSLNGSAVNLAGPVLGALPTETYNTVQEVCAKSMDRHQSYMMTRMNEGGAMDPIEMAKLRDFTRTELAKILTPEELEEFLLRYSHNSSKLRQDTRGLDLTPDEFRKIFRAIDPVEHKVQLEYGGPEVLSQKQRDQLESQRDRAIQEALSTDRFQQYLATKDPLYRQAQTTAMQYGMNSKAVQPLYQLQKVLEAKRMQITQNSALTPEQKAQALQSIGTEQQQTLQRMLGDTTYRQ